MKAKRFAKMTAEQYKSLAAEKDIQKGVVDLLTLVGIPFSVTDASLAVDSSGRGVRRSVTTEGWPDITAVLPVRLKSGRGFLQRYGLLWAIETKTAKGRLRQSQVDTLNALKESGAVVTVARSVADVARVLIDAGVEHLALKGLVR